MLRNFAIPHFLDATSENLQEALNLFLSRSPWRLMWQPSFADPPTVL